MNRIDSLAGEAECDVSKIYFHLFFISQLLGKPLRLLSFLPSPNTFFLKSYIPSHTDMQNYVKYLKNFFIVV